MGMLFELVAEFVVDALFELLPRSLKWTLICTIGAALGIVVLAILVLR